MHGPQTKLDHGEGILSGHADVISGTRLLVAFHVHCQNCLFGIFYQVIPIHGHLISGSQVSELDCLRP